MGRRKTKTTKTVKKILTNQYFVGLMAITMLIFTFYGCYSLIRKAQVSSVGAIILSAIYLVLALGIIWSYEKED